MDKRRAEKFVMLLANTTISLREATAEEAERDLGEDCSLGGQARAIDDGPIRKLLRDYPEVFEEVREGRLPFLIHRISTDLRRAWDARDVRHRDWYLFCLRSFYHKHASALPVATHRSLVAATLLQDDETLTPEQQDINQRRLEMLRSLAAESEQKAAEPPAATPLEAAVFHLQQIGNQLRHCPNTECPAPYFIANRKRQKYCSEICATPAQREAKRKWWHANRGTGEA